MQVQSAVTKYCFNPFDATVFLSPPQNIKKPEVFYFQGV